MTNFWGIVIVNWPPTRKVQVTTVMLLQGAVYKVGSGEFGDQEKKPSLSEVKILEGNLTSVLRPFLNPRESINRSKKTI